LGPFKNAGREWRPAGEPVPVNVYDFAEPATGKVIPYGIDDIAASTGRVNVGTDHDTAAFAVASIRRWWHAQGAPSYPHATPVADHRRCRRRQRLPHPRLEERTARAGRRDRADHHRLPPRNRGVTIPPVFRQRRWRQAHLYGQISRASP
ncbi:DDE family transposase, partial [Nonomuraea fuscirosea]